MENKEIIKRKIKGLRPYNHIEDTQEILYRILGVIGEGGKVEVDNKTISQNPEGQIQLGIPRRGNVERGSIVDDGYRYNFYKDEIHITNVFGGEVSISPTRGINANDNHQGREFTLNEYGVQTTTPYGYNRLYGSEVSGANKSTDGNVTEQFVLNPEGVTFTKNNNQLKIKSPLTGHTKEVYLPISVNSVVADDRGNIQIPSSEVLVDNKTITENERGELQLGKKVGDNQVLTNNIKIQSGAFPERYTELKPAVIVYESPDVKTETNAGGIKVEGKDRLKNIDSQLTQGELSLSDNRFTPIRNAITASGMSVYYGNNTLAIRNGLIDYSEGVENGPMFNITTDGLEVKSDRGRARFDTQFLFLDNEDKGETIVMNNEGLLVREKGNESFSVRIPSTKPTKPIHTLITTINNKVADLEGNIDIPLEEVKVDNKTIFKNENGELQFGKVKSGYYETNERFKVVNSTQNTTFSTLSPIGMEVESTFGVVGISSSGMAVRGRGDKTTGASYQHEAMALYEYKDDNKPRVDIKYDGVTVSNIKYKTIYDLEGITKTDNTKVLKLKIPKVVNRESFIPITVNNLSADESGNINIPIEVDNKVIFFNAEGEIQFGNSENKIEILHYEQKGLGHQTIDSNNNRYNISTTGGLAFYKAGNQNTARLDFNQLSVTNDRHTFVHDFDQVSSSNVNGAFVLTKESLSIQSPTNNIDHSFKFPKNTDAESTMVVSVNGYKANEEGVITMESRAYGYERFMRFVTERRLYSAIYEYNSEMMGTTIEDLFYMSSNVLKLRGTQPLLDIETLDVLELMEFGDTEESAKNAVIPASMEGRTFLIGKEFG